MSFETVNATQVPSRTKGHEDNGSTGARDACDRRCSQRTHYSTIINTPIQETSTELPPLHTQAQTQAQVSPKVSVAAVARSASKTDQQMQMGKLIDGKLGLGEPAFSYPFDYRLTKFCSNENKRHPRSQNNRRFIKRASQTQQQNCSSSNGKEEPATTEDSHAWSKTSPVERC